MPAAYSSTAIASFTSAARISPMRRPGIAVGAHREFRIEREVDVRFLKIRREITQFAEHGRAAGLHVENQLEAGRARRRQHPIDHRTALAAAIPAVAARLRLRDDGDELVRGHDFLMGHCRIRGCLLPQTVRQRGALQTPEDPHPFRPGIAIPRQEQVLVEDRRRLGAGETTASFAAENGAGAGTGTITENRGGEYSERNAAATQQSRQATRRICP